MSRSRTLSPGFAAALLLAALPARPAPPSYAADVEPILVKHCRSCHSTETPKAELVLDPGTGLRALLDRTSTQVPGAKLVVPGDVEGSYLWAKLMGSARVGKGMPRTLFGAKKLPRQDLDVIREWIAAGAQP